MFTKKFAHITVAFGCLLALLFFHNQIAEIILSLTANMAKTGSGPLAAKMHLQYQDGVTTGTAGIVVFCLLRALEIHIREKNLSNQIKLNSINLALQLLRWAVVLVSGDIVIQNFSGIHTTFFNYSMRWQAVGSLMAIELLILFRFFYSIKQIQPTDQTQIDSHPMMTKAKGPKPPEAHGT